MTSPVRAVDLDVAPDAEVPVVLALGSNLGDRAATLRSCLTALDTVPGLRLTAVSPVVETAPVGPAQPDYLNAVVLAVTQLSARALLHAVQRIEAAHGRIRAERWGPRTLDIDVIAYDDLAAADGELTLPHERAGTRAFVLAPWLAVDPEASLPTPAGSTSVSSLLERLELGDAVRGRPDIDLADAWGRTP